MKPIKFYIIALLAMLLTASCGVIFEEDLTKEKVTILSPPDGYVSGTQTQELVWEELEVVDSYRVQIVADSFEYIVRYVLDTVVTGNRLTVTLTPDEYEWRVTGLNSASETEYDEYKLTITQDTTLGNQLVNMLYPQDNQVYESDSVAFFWDKLLFAQNYQLQVATDPSFNSQLIEQDVTTPNDFYYMVNALGIGDFYWRIRALRNNVDTTAWSASRYFNVNALPVHQSPANNATVNLAVNLDWSSASNVQRDSLYIYYGSEATPFITLGTSNTNYLFTASDTTGKGAGTYYWELRSLSTTGFLTGYSGLRGFVVN